MRLARRVDALAVRLADGDARKVEVRRRIAALDDECGCTMGGIFLGVAAGLAVAYFLIGGGFGLGSGLSAAGFVFGASLLGKAFGLGAAKLRLLRLQRLLAAQLAPGEVDRVHVH
ncbi:MAG: hypothetical protein M3271_08885 [Actinomycetota bacterium]|nr:hypothetical protein [Actinomycetota bacterium]